MEQGKKVLEFNNLGDFVFLSENSRSEAFKGLCLWAQEDNLIHLPPNWNNMSQLVQFVGVFDSVTQARKNGWDRPIPTGWSEHKLPKRFGNRSLNVWNPIDYSKA